MYEDLKNKTILVTGAGQGIGKALCQQLAKVEAKVIALARSPEQLEHLQEEYPSIQIIVVDLTSWNKTRDKLKFVPKLDGLVNNAGVAIIKPFLELSEKDFDDTFDINLKAAFNVTQALAPKFNTGASIVMVSSLAATRSFCGHTIYSATKAGLDSLTRSLALEFGIRKVRVNSVNPTVVLTQMGVANWSDPQKSQPLLSHIPLGRFCEVNEVVDCISYLLSDKSSFVNGHHLNVEGGYSVS